VTVDGVDPQLVARADEAGECPALVVVFLGEGELAVRARVHAQLQRLRVGRAEADPTIGHEGQDRAGGREHGDRVEVAVQLDRRAAFVGQAGEHVGPPPGRQPGAHGPETGRPVRGRGDRGDEQPVAEAVLVAHPVGVEIVRVVVVHRLHQRLAVEVRAPVHRVQVGHEAVPQP
jgi:hypothetical protein